MRGGLPDGRSDRLLEPLRVPVHQFPGLPEDGRLARRLLRDLQHVQRGGNDLPRRAGLRLRPDEDAGGAGSHAAMLQHQHDLRRPPPRRPGRLAPAAVRRSELRSGSGRDEYDAGVLEVPRRLDHAGEHDFHRPVHDHGRQLCRGLRWRYVHPPGRSLAAT